MSAILLRVVGCGLAVLWLTACGGGGGGGSSQTASSAPTITTQPHDVSVHAGGTATFTVTTAGSSPMSYQWKRGVMDVGSDAPSYTVSSVQPADHGATFHVVVSNSEGQVESREALLTVLSNSEAIIINHANTDLSQIPPAQILAARQSLHIAYGHTSHGSQLITGMNTLFSWDQQYAWSEDGSSGSLYIDDYAMGGDVGYYPAWVNNTRAYLGTPDGGTGRGLTHPDINVVMWSWCGQVAERNQQSLIDTYLAPMSQLEADYPGVTFVYMTGHLDGTGVTGNLHQRNEQIRAYCLSHDKVLFDFADIESYDPSGNGFLALSADDGCNYTGGNWVATHPGDSLSQLAAACGDCAHSQRLNCILKARAAWWLWARLAGWGGT